MSGLQRIPAMWALEAAEDFRCKQLGIVPNYSNCETWARDPSNWTGYILLALHIEAVGDDVRKAITDTLAERFPTMAEYACRSKRSAGNDHS